MTVTQALTGNGVDTGVTAEVVTITPAVAAVMLRGNVVNRKLRKQRVLLYGKQMALGQWRVTGESIVFDPNGRLLQGQHRLTACVESGAPFTTVVVRGVDAEAMRVMDTGLSRTAADVFKLEGISNSSWQAASVRQLIAIKGGFVRDTGRMALITRDELIDFHGANSDLLNQAGALSGPTYQALRHSRAAWVSLALLLLEADAELALLYFDGLGTGINMGLGDARLAFRAHCLNAIHARRSITWQTIVATGIHNWNSWIDNKQITHVKAWKPVHAWPEIKS